MTEQNDGGPAFPKANKYPCEQNGMTLRDYFAAKALAGIIASYSGENIGLPPVDTATARAYDYADWMLAEREKGGA